MKLKEGFIVHSVQGEEMMVATGKAAAAFNGLVRQNKTASFILNLLMEDITEEQIVKNVCCQYEVDEAAAAADVRQFLASVQEAGFLDE